MIHDEDDEDDDDDNNEGGEGGHQRLCCVVRLQVPTDCICNNILPSTLPSIAPAETVEVNGGIRTK